VVRGIINSRMGKLIIRMDLRGMGRRYLVVVVVLEVGRRVRVWVCPRRLRRRRLVLGISRGVRNSSSSKVG